MSEEIDNSNFLSMRDKTDLMTLLKFILIKPASTSAAERFTYEGLHYTNRYLKKTSNHIMNQVKFNIIDPLSDMKDDFSKSDNETEN
ncbi:uncharacterized protein PADG_11686 [Paracoccidioides brasiliensis Pb18]|uniref:Uncharacterized protein n=1 Tax=Paracoccidioides brasiliensis (strain Pb18) TaxID=502780 RepID=A0A0A0HXN9_PARBD|nr:uncharacterized protein PADG_11686 [Paracoccidioides brasiliensis Pb18]KGM92150.1 hypothetical protein PADG_11686 [Paracoccidioides brasiliensis Pb18]